MTEVEAQIDGCEYLFLTDIQELGGNRLRIIVQEGNPAGKPKTITVGESSIADCTPIEVTPESACFEIEWTRYVAYAVLSESYACCPAAEQSYTGKRCACIQSPTSGIIYPGARSQRMNIREHCGTMKFVVKIKSSTWSRVFRPRLR